MSLGRLTLSAAKTRIAKLLSICATDARVAEYLNKATERLIIKGKWVGTTGRYRICAANSIITWPREIETIESYAVCNSPGTIRNGWFEFLGNGVGLAQDDTYQGNTMLDRGESPVFADPAGDSQKLRLYADSASDAGKEVLLQFYDENGNKVRTLKSGTYYDGEWVTLVAPPNYAVTQNYVLAGETVFGVQKPVTVGTVRLYCYDTVATTQVPLGYYEHDETLPSYRRSFIPYLTNFGTCDNTSDCDSTDQQITVMAKRKHIPVSADNDWLMLGNLPAYEEMVQAVKEFEPGGDYARGMIHQAAAVKLLEEELRSHQGNGVIVQPKFQSPATFGAGRIGLNRNSSGCACYRRCS